MRTSLPEAAYAPVLVSATFVIVFMGMPKLFRAQMFTPASVMSAWVPGAMETQVLAAFVSFGVSRFVPGAFFIMSGFSVRTRIMSAAVAP